MLSLLLTLAVFGFVVWLILQIPMPGLIRNIIVGVVALFLIIWVLGVLGVPLDLPRARLR